MFITVLFILVYCRRMDKEDVVNLYIVILFGHKNDILPFETTWSNIEGIVISEMG